MTIEELYKQADTITDGLGMHIDKGIRKILVGLWVHGIQTTGSCEGHKNGALPFPWVDIETSDPEGWENDESIQAQWKVANDKQMEQAAALLAKFDKNHPFILKPRGLYGAVRMQPNEDTAKPEMLVKFQQQMNDFADFLLENPGK